MEGEPDVKKSRLEYEQPGHSALRHPHHPAALPAPPQFPHPPQSHGHGLGPAPQLFREVPPDSRSLPFQPPPPAHQGPSDHRPSYGSVNHHSSRSFSSSETGTPRPHPPGEHKGGPPLPPEQHPHMEHAVHGGVYPIDPHANVGLPYHVSPADQYPPSAHPSYPSTPVAAYAPTHQFAPSAAAYGVARRKQVRAQQACNNCRQRKQKCDEARPCAYCKQEGLTCEYKEVPPPKTDRTMQEISRKLDELHSQMDEVQQFRESADSVQLEVHQMQSKLDQVLQVVLSMQQQNQRLAYTIRSPTAKADLGPAANLPSHAGSSNAIAAISEAHVAETELGSHRTGAHHLHHTWPMIRIFYERAQVFPDGTPDKEYVQHEEEKQQKDLQLYSWLAQDEDAPSDLGALSPPQSVPDVSSATSPSEYPRSSRFTSATHLGETGGWNVDGTMKLDASTIKKYFNSYIKNMWVMHPFLDAAWLKEKTDRFIARYSPGPPRTSSWNHPNAPASEPYSTQSLKRKRQPGFAENHSSPSSPGLSHSQSARRPDTFERSIENAIVLLVLALGCILEQDEFLLHDLGSPYPSGSANTSFSSHNYQNNFAKQSPAQQYSNVPYSSAPSPAHDFVRLTSEYQAIGADVPSHHDRKEKERRNQRWKAERIPGIAYFAAATDILGNRMTTNDIPHSQAFLMAGLYYGQIGRILDSWQWIFRGCNAIHAMGVSQIFRQFNENKMKDPQNGTSGSDDDLQIFLCLFWSALQLDSDIRAELDSLHADAMSKYAGLVPWPSRLIGLVNYNFIDLYHEKFDVANVAAHFMAQLYIRKQLNRTHVSLYNEKEPGNRTTTGQPLAWDEAKPSVLWEALTTGFRALPQGLRWDEQALPAADINQARLRGKYYGASYVITRPFLRWAIYFMEERPLEPISINDEWYEVGTDEGDPTRLQILPRDGPLSTLDPNKAMIEENVLWACRQCIFAAMKSTVAFDGLAPGTALRRPRVTNIHGTASAQYGNMLVLGAAYASWLWPYIDSDRFFWLLERTINLLRNLSPLSRVFAIHQKVLETVRTDCKEFQRHRAQERTPQAGLGAMHPPNRLDRLNSAPASGVDSVNSSFSNEMS